MADEIARSDWASLYARDQLAQQIRSGKALTKFDDGGQREPDESFYLPPSRFPPLPSRFPALPSPSAPLPSPPPFRSAPPSRSPSLDWPRQVRFHSPPPSSFNATRARGWSSATRRGPTTGSESHRTQTECCCSTHLASPSRSAPRRSRTMHGGGGHYITAGTATSGGVGGWGAVADGNGALPRHVGDMSSRCGRGGGQEG